MGTPRIARSMIATILLIVGSSACSKTESKAKPEPAPKAKPEPRPKPAPPWFAAPISLDVAPVASGEPTQAPARKAMLSVVLNPSEHVSADKNGTEQIALATGNLQWDELTLPVRGSFQNDAFSLTVSDPRLSGWNGEEARHALSGVLSISRTKELIKVDGRLATANGASQWTIGVEEANR